MAEKREYVLGNTTEAARRLQIQDQQFGSVSELLLDELNLKPTARVVEIGTGAGGFTRRVMKRLGKEGVLVGVDYTAGLLKQAQQYVSGVSEATFEPLLADVSDPGPWLDGFDAVVGRTVLHHIPFAEGWLGKLRHAVRPGTRIGFVEPEFRALLGRFTLLEARGQDDLAVLRVWAEGITKFYETSKLSPGVGSTMAWAMQAAGFKDVRVHMTECPTTDTVIENLLLYYDEIRERYVSLGIMTEKEIDEQQRQLRDLPAGELPAVWGIHRVTATA